ncbi:MBL fold metallo-hydrolase [Aquimarina sp. TRL1]|uniref:MBL fold metallo-hydrolase n=1 Tax=Aquimarina sp. (strain TRL1) TaxID=2736252 RepID=UPI00158C7FA3|nr:MBL fold metallo-hydrolase [Aquimarina sp. TRL1]QKX06697.1 MBL fold metallo-hydrolase [Aquimarina sp. TRL1]
MTDTLISVEELRTKLENKERIQVIDIRPLEEREEWKIPGSVHVDVYHQLKSGKEDVFSTMDFLKDETVVTVCAAGKTSLIAMEQLRKKGVKAYSLEGGMRSWTRAWNTAITEDKHLKIIQVRRTGKGCLSYIIGSDGEALVIDPSLDIEVYISIAKNNNWKITHVLDTHIHADHFSRAKRLAATVKAQLLMPPNTALQYPYEKIQDQQLISFGLTNIQAIATPGHTSDSFSYLLQEKYLFSGDTLFTKGVGRPDLKANTDQAKIKAGILYDSLQKILSLSKEIIVFPGHISEPVSFDGKTIANSLGNIIDTVPLLTLEKQLFVQALLANIPLTPPNYEKIVALNYKGDIKERELIGLEAGANRCAIS